MRGRSFVVVVKLLAENRLQVDDADKSIWGR
jgi:hypothetical protein